MSTALTRTKDGKKILTPKQVKAIIVLANGGTYKKAAEAAGVNERTIGKWVQTSSFHREFVKTMERMRYQFEARAIAAGGDAIAVLHKELGHGDVDVRLKAGTALSRNAVQLGTRYKELAVEGALPAQPMIVFPSSTTMPWNSKPVEVVDVKAREIPEGNKYEEDE